MKIYSFVLIPQIILLFQSPKAESKLFCSFEHHNFPQLFLMPLKVEVLSLYPRVVLFREFFSPRQSEDFIQFMKPDVSGLD